MAIKKQEELKADAANVGEENVEGVGSGAEKDDAVGGVVNAGVERTPASLSSAEDNIVKHMNANGLPPFEVMQARTEQRKTQMMPFPEECRRNRPPESGGTGLRFAWVNSEAKAVEANSVEFYETKGYVVCNKMTPKPSFWGKETLRNYLCPKTGALRLNEMVLMVTHWDQYRSNQKALRDRRNKPVHVEHSQGGVKDVTNSEMANEYFKSRERAKRDGGSAFQVDVDGTPVKPEEVNDNIRHGSRNIE